MNKTIAIIVGCVAVIIIGGVYITTNIQTKEEGMMDDKVSGVETAEEKMVDEKAMEKESMEDGQDVMVKGSYETYAPEKLARAEKGDVVLFFHASWCPSCRGLNANLEKSLDAIPEGVSILKVDYDTESELKKKYGVTYQHTLVQVDANGMLINKWSGSPTLGSLVSNIK